MSGPAYGRIPAPDPRDAEHLMRSLMPRVVALQSVDWKMRYGVLDQGQTGTCVGHGFKHKLMLGPMEQTGPRTRPTAFSIYDSSIVIDEFPENDYDIARQMGTSVRAGAKVLKALGYIKEYSWSTTVDDVLAWLCTRGPVVIGVNWYSSMEEPDTEGIIRIGLGAQVAGGHCVALSRYDHVRGLIGGPNSWGRSWGVNGRFWLPCSDLARLLREDGEVCAADEIRVRLRPVG
jgi:hypothetical protein